MRRIVHLQQIADQLSDAFTDTVKVTKSYIPAANIPGRVIEHKEQLMKSAAEELSVARQKRGRLIGSKDSVPRKRKMTKQCSAANDDKNLKEQIASEKQPIFEKTRNPDNTQTLREEQSLEKTHESRNSEISVDYTHGKIIINDVFAFTVVTDITNDHDPQTINECRLRHDWLK